jgi:two-component system sensor histidine kinase YesM
MIIFSRQVEKSLIRNKLMGKFIAMLSSIMLLAFGVTGYITYQLHLNISEKEIIEQFASRTEQVAARIDLRLQDVYRLSDQIVINPTIVQFVSNSSMGRSADYMDITKLYQTINPMVIGLPNLMTFYIFDERNQYYMPNNTSYLLDFGKLAREQVNEALQRSDGELVWVKGKFTEAAAGHFNNSGIGQILAARWLKDTQMHTYGALVMVLNESILSNDLNQTIKGEEGRVYLFNRDQLIYSDEKDADKIDLDLLHSIEPAEIRTLSGSPYLFAQSTTEATKFKVVARMSVKALHEKSRVIMNVAIIGAVINALLAGTLVVIASGRLLRPIRELVRGMRKVREGDLEARVRIGTKDELAYIGESFNSMVEHVAALIKEVYEKHLREREAELTALQAQLNPHFLYNTLDMIHSKLYLQDDKETAGLIISLSSMLRYALEPAGEETTVAVELQQIYSYLRLQQARHEHDLTVAVEVQEEVAGCGIIRVLLQPIIENAFVHAFRDHTGMKRLSLRSFRSGDLLIMEIEDNGCGFPPEKWERLSKRQTTNGGPWPEAVGSGEQQGIGLHTVIRRMELIYGPPYGLDIKSIRGQGTVVRLQLPYRIM